MRNLLCALALPVLLIGCEGLKGSFEASTDLELKNRRKKVVKVEAGSYEAEIKFNSKKKFTLELNKETGNEKTKVVFKVPKGVEFGENETVELSANQIGQNYDAVVADVSSKTLSDLKEGRRQCSRSVPVRRCRRYPNGGYQCFTDWRTVWGYQFTTFRVETTTGTKTLNLVESGVDVGVFNANYSKSINKYEMIGPCSVGAYPHGPYGPYPY